MTISKRRRKHQHLEDATAEAADPPLGGRSWRSFLYDVPAAAVVFLIAVPLCLGIAHASGAPLIAGLVTGIVGGLLVAWASGSPLSVSGPAAGLTAIVLAGITTLGYEAFLVAVVLAGLIQIGLGALKAGIIGFYFPSSVIRGMLAGIGWVIILKQIPHAIGFDANELGDLSFWGSDARNTFTEITAAVADLRWGALVVGMGALAILFAWDLVPAERRPRWLPGPLLAVVFGVLLNAGFEQFAPALAISSEHLVGVPTDGIAAFWAQLAFPDFARALEPSVWTVALTIAIVASLETLLCLEAVDKQDPYKRVSPPNRELVAQGLGNIVAGLLGGIPMTSVIVRGSANVQAGARTRMSAFLHGVFLLVAVAALPFVLNLISFAALAAVLLHVGYKLTAPKLFKQMYSYGSAQFVPFMATIIGILATDLLVGVGIGLAFSVFFLLKRSLEHPYFVSFRGSHREGIREVVHIEFAEHVTFFHKASVKKVLHDLAPDSVVEIDASRSVSIDWDVLEILHNFRIEAPLRSIEVRFVKVPDVTAALGVTAAIRKRKTTPTAEPMGPLVV